jgi:hypothetical protein
LVEDEFAVPHNVEWEPFLRMEAFQYSLYPAISHFVIHKNNLCIDVDGPSYEISSFYAPMDIKISVTFVHNQKLLPGLIRSRIPQTRHAVGKKKVVDFEVLYLISNNQSVPRIVLPYSPGVYASW